MPRGKRKRNKQVKDLTEIIQNDHKGNIADEDRDFTIKKSNKIANRTPSEAGLFRDRAFLPLTRLFSLNTTTSHHHVEVRATILGRALSPAHCRQPNRRAWPSAVPASSRSKAWASLL